MSGGPYKLYVTSGVGLRRVHAMVRDTDGVAAVPSGQTAGEGWPGVQLQGALSVNITVPEKRRIAARGDDRTYKTFKLPAEEGPNGQIRLSKGNMRALEILQNLVVAGSSPNRIVAHGADVDEVPVVLWFSQRGIDSEEDSASFGEEVWHTYVLPNAEVEPRPSTMEDGAVTDYTWPVVANDSVVDPLGRTVTEALYGCTKAPWFEITTHGKFGLNVFEGDGSETVFYLRNLETDTSSPTLYTGGKTMVAVDGTLQTTGITVDESAGTVTFSTAPDSGAKVVVLFEYSD